MVPQTPSSDHGAFDRAIEQATTLGALEGLAGITPEMRTEFWLAFSAIENEAERLAAGIASLKQRIRARGMMA